MGRPPTFLFPARKNPVFLSLQGLWGQQTDKRRPGGKSSHCLSLCTLTLPTPDACPGPGLAGIYSSSTVHQRKVFPVT